MRMQKNNMHHSAMDMQLSIAMHVVWGKITSPMSHSNIARNALNDIILFQITINSYRSPLEESDRTRGVSKAKLYSS
jgi:hypothetical protein